MKKLLIAAVIIGTLLLIVTLTRNNADHPGRYCSQDGILSDTQPIQSHRSYCISASTVTIEPGQSTTYSFRIIDDQGNTLKDFAVTHEKIMHFIIVRKDLTEFEHLHPEFNTATGEFTVTNLVLPTNGEYRFFADFMPMPSGGVLALPVTTYTDLWAGAAYEHMDPPLTDFRDVKTFEGYETSLSANPKSLRANEAATLSFTLIQNGVMVKDLEAYLGALGHAIVLREGTLEFIHAHPQEIKTQTGSVPFEVMFPSAGIYKIFAQFQHQGKVFTTDFAVKIVAGVDEIPESSMDHSSN